MVLLLLLLLLRCAAAGPLLQRTGLFCTMSIITAELGIV